ncbi:MAG: dTDP-4-dehydrorhamnose 3,5-epimerase [Coxiellaceae bacterium]|nr:dTDP-4-dehydrorhamnose 3,5-epimerase [Coxiellaceae bacterium]
MKITNTAIQDVKIIEPTVFPDARGHFFEVFRENNYQEKLGITDHFVQDNCSVSKKNVLRGMHYQVENPQGKLVITLVGAIFDVVVDIRPNSPSYKKWVGIELSSDNKKQLWVPAGLAHGFLVLSDSAQVLYKCTNYYHPGSEKTLRWDDPTIGIEWPLNGTPIMAEKDLKGEYL